jgi:phage gp45-like
MDLMEIAQQLRILVNRAVVKSTRDNGGSQTATIETHRHVERSDVEVVQQFGFYSRPPGGAGTMIVFAVGGDHGDLVGLPMGAPAFRLGDLAEGESAMANAKGDRVIARADGTIEVISDKAVTVKVRTVSVSVTEDRVVSRIGEGAAAPRTVVRPAYVKMKKGVHFLAVDDTGVICSVVPVVAPEPEPGV